MKTPNDLRARIAADMKPVRPLLPPWQRALLLVPAAALAWAAAPGVMGVRGDLDSIGPWLAWGGSLVQFGIAVALIAAALREAVPAEAPPRSASRALLAAGVLSTIVLALATNAVSPEPEPRAETFASWWFCWEGAVLAGAPLVLLVVVLLARGLPMRPAFACALAGLGVGAAVDGGWRLFCNYSNPAHVILSHGGAVLALAVIGMVAGVTLDRVRQRSRQEDL